MIIICLAQINDCASIKNTKKKYNHNSLQSFLETNKRVKINEGEVEEVDKHKDDSNKLINVDSNSDIEFLQKNLKIKKMKSDKKLEKCDDNEECDCNCIKKPDPPKICPPKPPKPPKICRPKLCNCDDEE